MIKPTVGQVVWFWPHGKRDEFEQPCAAMIAHVWHDRMVNIGYLNSDGGHRCTTSVPLIQEGDTIEGDAIHYCTWMPYQVEKQKNTHTEIVGLIVALERICGRVEELAFQMINLRNQMNALTTPTRELLKQEPSSNT